jgi:Pvc16 N-terminal domain/Carboxypeptidase regulatory-like domain
VIDYLDGLLSQLFTTRIPGLTPAQVSFNAPDQDWRNLVLGMPTIALNVYLVELYQDLERRSNETFSTAVGGIVERRRAPARLHCRYLISAWSPAKANLLTDPAIEEAVLLYDVAQVLVENTPLDAAAIYRPGPLPPGFPDDMLEPILPAVVAPSEPFPKLADFWMRMDTIWKPVVDLIVTMPVAYAARPAGPPVTTLFGEYGTVEHPALEELVAIGGVVRLTPSLDPVPGAWVRLVELNRSATSNAAGQFVFTGIRRGSYTLEAGALSHATVTRAIDVPSLSGEYDLTLV